MSPAKKQNIKEGFEWLFRAGAIALLTLILNNSNKMYDAYVRQEVINAENKNSNQSFGNRITSLEQNKLDKLEFYNFKNRTKD